MGIMTSRQRVLAALNLQPPDRVPIDIGGSPATTIIGQAYERLKAHLGIAEETHYMKRKSRSVAITFPFNLLAGIPIYFEISKRLCQ